MKTPDYYINKAKELLEGQLAMQEIEKQLVGEGADEQTISQVMAEIKKARTNKKVNRGLSLITIGIVFLGAGFLCTLCLNHTAFNYHISLYGFTSLGILLVFAGMIDIFG